LTKHAADIPRTPLNPLALRDPPDGKGPLTHYVQAGNDYLERKEEEGRTFPVVDYDDSGRPLLHHTDSDRPDWPGVDVPYEKDPSTGNYSNPDFPKLGELVLHKGQSGVVSDAKLVKQLQMFLLALGYGLDNSGPAGDGVDGVFGDSTDSAVREFQKQHTDFNGDPLKEDGKVGPKTADALNRALVGVTGDDGIDIDGDLYWTQLELTAPSKFQLFTLTRVVGFSSLPKVPLQITEDDGSTLKNCDRIVFVVVD